MASTFSNAIIIFQSSLLLLYVTLLDKPIVAQINLILCMDTTRCFMPSWNKFVGKAKPLNGKPWRLFSLSHSNVRHKRLSRDPGSPKASNTTTALSQHLWRGAERGDSSHTIMRKGIVTSLGMFCILRFHCKMRPLISPNFNITFAYSRDLVFLIGFHVL